MQARWRHSLGPRALSCYAEAVAVGAAAVLLSEALRSELTAGNLALLLMLAVVFIGYRHGLASALVTSFVCVSGMSYFHAPPRFSFRVNQYEHLVMLGCFVLASLLTGGLAERLRRQLVRSQSLADRNERLLEVSRRLTGGPSDDLLASIRPAIGEAFHAECALLVADGTGALEPADCDGPQLEPEDAAAAGWCFTRISDDPNLGARAGSWMFLRLDGQDGPLGVLGVRRPIEAGPLARDQRALLLALRDMVAVALDRRRLAERIRESQMSGEREKLRAALLSSVSHDLRTPLAGITGAASTLVGLRGSLPETAQKELLATILSEAERLDRFVANLIDMTRLEAGGPEPSPSWSDFRDIVADALRGLSRVLADREIEIDIAANFPLLYVDAFLLERVIANLLDNAAKYSERGSPIAISAHRDRDTAVLRVSDRGRGIPHDQRDAVFTLFHRVRDTDKRVAGTGLGLAICRGLTEALRGSIGIRDGIDGKGTCVEVRLPIDELEAEVQAE
ncbi:MAG TPA: ATP-binding protein [Myxococcota bacterium]|nr:ATP-binding protein [Myxococcota bacterium]